MKLTAIIWALPAAGLALTHTVSSSYLSRFSEQADHALSIISPSSHHRAPLSRRHSLHHGIHNAKTKAQAGSNFTKPVFMDSNARVRRRNALEEPFSPTIGPDLSHARQSNTRRSLRPRNPFTKLDSSKLVERGSLVRRASKQGSSGNSSPSSSKGSPRSLLRTASAPSLRSMVAGPSAPSGQSVREIVKHIETKGLGTPRTTAIDNSQPNSRPATPLRFASPGRSSAKPNYSTPPNTPNSLPRIKTPRPSLDSQSPSPGVKGGSPATTLYLTPQASPHNTPKSSNSNGAGRSSSHLVSEISSSSSPSALTPARSLSPQPNGIRHSNSKAHLPSIRSGSPTSPQSSSPRASGSTSSSTGKASGAAYQIGRPILWATKNPAKATRLGASMAGNLASVGAAVAAARRDIPAAACLAITSGILKFGIDCYDAKDRVGVWHKEKGVGPQEDIAAAKKVAAAPKKMVSAPASLASGLLGSLKGSMSRQPSPERAWPIDELPVRRRDLEF